MSKRPKVQDPDAISLLAPARATREALGPNDEFAPLVLFAPRRGQAQMAVLDDEGRLHDLVADVLAGMRARLGPPLWIAVTTDAFVKPTPAPLTYEHGKLAEAFAAGDPEVTEQMVVLLRRRGVPVEVASQPYRYLPSEGWEWSEPELIDGFTAPIADVLDRFIV